MKQISAVDLRPGNVINYENSIFKVVQYDSSSGVHGNPIIKLFLSNIKTGETRTLSVSTEVKFVTVGIQRSTFQYMYDDGETIFSLDGSQFPMHKVLQEHSELIKEAGEFMVVEIDGEISEITLSRNAKVRIISTESSLKGVRKQPLFKSAKLCNGWTIQVPIFIEEGDIVIVDVIDLENLVYKSRA